MRLRFFLMPLVLAALLAGLAQGHADGREMIVLSGGPALRFFEKGKGDASHDKFWGNFVVSASLRVKELVQNKAPGDTVTWLVYRPGYQRRGLEMGQDLLGSIKAMADADGAALFWFDDKQEVINYLNSGKDRTQVPVGGFEYFGHSNKACFMFDYSNEFDSMAREFLHVNDLSRIIPSDFAPNAVCKSWGCHSGEMYSAQWKAHMGIPMVGAIGKTDYSSGTLPFLSSEGGQWTE